METGKADGAAKTELYLSLGSNQGDRAQNLRRARSLLDEALPPGHLRASRVVESPAWGFDGADFLNQCVLYAVPAEADPVSQALDLLRLAQRVEATLGRDVHPPVYDASGNRVYTDRPIDIDLLYFGDLALRTRDLILPHPLISQRPFVLHPLLEIASPGVALFLSSSLSRQGTPGGNPPSP